MHSFHQLSILAQSFSSQGGLGGQIGSIFFFAGRAWGPADATPRAEYGQKAEASALPAWSDIATGEPGHATHEVE